MPALFPKSFVASLVLLSLAATSAFAITVEEATTGAVAVVLVSEKCYPARQGEAARYAIEDLKRMLGSLPSHEQAYALDAANDKLRAMRISGQTYQCADVGHLRVMAQTWGFGHLILD